MKLRWLILGGSLAANVALGLALWRKPMAKSVAERAIVVAATKPPLVEEIPYDGQAWTALWHGDDADVVARLRREGFPPEVVKALIKSRVAARYADRQSVLSHAPLAPYWRGADFYRDRRDPSVRAAQRRLDREISDEVKRLLGPDSIPPNPYEQMRRLRKYANLSDAKVTQLKAIDTDYRDLMQEVSDESNGVILPEDREKLRFLIAQRRTDIANTLTPEELDEFDLRGSSSTGGLRFRLIFFKPTEEEFRTMARLQLEFDARYGTAYLSPSEQQARRDAEPALKAQFKSALGPERFADYEIATDPRYREFDRTLGDAHCPPGTTAHVIAMRQEFQRRADAIREDSALNAETRALRLGTLGEEVKLRLANLLGPNAYTIYARSDQGWLNQFRPPASTADRDR